MQLIVESLLSVFLRFVLTKLSFIYIITLKRNKINILSATIVACALLSANRRFC